MLLSKVSSHISQSLTHSVVPARCKKVHPTIKILVNRNVLQIFFYIKTITKVLITK